MAFINFGYAGSNLNSAQSQAQSINNSMKAAPLTNFNTGDVIASQNAKLILLGGNYDFLWGCNLWANSKTRVTK